MAYLLRKGCTNVQFDSYRFCRSSISDINFCLVNYGIQTVSRPALKYFSASCNQVKSFIILLTGLSQKPVQPEGIATGRLKGDLRQEISLGLADLGNKRRNVACRRYFK